MNRLKKNGKTRLIFEETIIDLQEANKTEIHLYDEHLIEIVRTSDGKGYCAKVYELIAIEPPCKNPQMALEKAADLLIQSTTPDKRRN